MVEILNGDCRDILPDVLNKHNGRKIILVSDPPFNVGYHYKTYKDKMTEEQYYNLMGDIFGMRSSVIIHYPEALYKIAFQIGVFPEKVVSWVYNSNTAKQHRDIAFFGVKPDFKQVIQPYKNPNDKRIKKRIERGILGGGCMTGGM